VRAQARADLDLDLDAAVSALYGGVLSRYLERTPDPLTDACRAPHPRQAGQA
jgi:hypothetical protein